MRRFLLIGWLAMLLSLLIASFWYADWRYSLPTPVPENYQPVTMGSPVPLVKKLMPTRGRPIFLHFFNPNCPCSRFNIGYFKELARKYSREVEFKIIVLSNKEYTATEIQEKFNLRVPVLFDTSIAKACGVYSTPQAVIIDGAGRLYYRGNYNKSRFCTDHKTNFAEIALKGLLIHNPIGLNDPYALTAYGCRLPNCTK